GGLSWTSYRDHTLWHLEIDSGGASVYRTKLSALSSALPTRRRRRLGIADVREFGLEVIALIGTWRFREHRSVEVNAPGSSRTWDQHCPAQCHLFDAAL